MHPRQEVKCPHGGGAWETVGFELAMEARATWEILITASCRTTGIRAGRSGSPGGIQAILQLAGSVINPCQQAPAGMPPMGPDSRSASILLVGGLGLLCANRWKVE